MGIGEVRASRWSTTHRTAIAVTAIWLVIVALWADGLPRSAHADGGAPNLAYVVVGGAKPTALAIIDIAKRRLTGQIELGGDPQAVVLSVDSRFAYIPQASANSVAVVDTSARRVIAEVPAGEGPAALAADMSVTGDMFVADASGNSVTVIDLTQRRTVATIPVGRRPTSVAVAGLGSGVRDPSDAEVYVTNADSDTVSVISATTRRIIATIPVPGGPMSVLVPTSNNVAYVGTRTGMIVAIGVADHRVLGTLVRLRGSASGQMDYDAVTGEIYVPDGAGGVVEVLRPVSATDGSAALPPEPARTLPLGGGPSAVAITFDGSYGFVAQRDSGHVVMVDVAAHHTLAIVDVGGAPRAIVTGAYPPLLDQQSSNVAGIAAYVLFGVVLAGIVIFAFGGYKPLQRWWLRRGGARR